jgi:uncharacterized protein (TIGR03382 family)
VDAPENGLSYDLTGDVTVPTRGRVKVDVGAANQQADTGGAGCTSEPVAGSMTLTGEGKVTLDFDGNSACDGKSPMTGDVSGDYDWQGDVPLGGCDSSGGAPVAAGGVVALLALALRRPRRA